MGKKVNLKYRFVKNKNFNDVIIMIVGSYFLLGMGAASGVLFPVSLGVVLLLAIPLLRDAITIETWIVEEKRKLRK